MSSRLNHNQGLWTTVSFVFVVLFVFGSFITSEYFDREASLSGFVVKSFSDVDYEREYILQSSFVNEEALFGLELYYANGTKNRNSTCYIVISCQDLNIDLSETEFECDTNNSMEFSEDKDFYILNTSFPSVGNFQYNIACLYNDVLIITEDISFEVKRRLDDFSYGAYSNNSKILVNVEAPLTLVFNSINDYDNVEYLWEFGYEGEELKFSKYNFSRGSNEFHFSHTYNSTGNYTFRLVIDPNNKIEEKNKSNNVIEILIEVLPYLEDEFNCIIDKNYELQRDYFCPDGVLVEASNLELDCNGFTISGPGKNSSQVGVLIENSITVRNCTIENYNKGLVFNGRGSLFYSNIKNNNIGVVINSSNSVVENNTINENLIGFNVLRPYILKNNNILNDNSYFVNTSEALELRSNYFGTTNIDNIRNKIINSSDFTISTYYDKSIFENDKNEIFLRPVYKNINLNVISEEHDFATKVTLNVNSSFEMKCAYDYKDSNFYDMISMGNFFDVKFERVLFFYDSAVRTFFVKCLDRNSNEFSARSNQIVTQNIFNLRLESLKKDLEFYDNAKLVSEREKERLQDSIKQETNEFRIERLREDFERESINSDYLTNMHRLTGNYIQQFERQKENIEDLKYDLNNVLNTEVSDIESRIVILEKQISSEYESHLDRIFSSFREKIRLLEDLYLAKINILDQDNKIEKESLKFTLILHEYNLEKNNLDRVKFEKLNNINYNYYDTLRNIEDEREFYLKEIEVATRNKIIKGLELDIDLYNYKKIIFDDYINDLNLLKRRIDSSIQKARQGNRLTIMSDLEYLIQDVESLIDILEISIEDLDDKISEKDSQIQEAYNLRFENNNRNQISREPVSEKIFWSQAQGSDIRKELYGNFNVSEINIRVDKLNYSLIKPGSIEIKQLLLNPHSNPDRIIYDVFSIEIRNLTRFLKINLMFEQSLTSLRANNIEHKSISLLFYNTTLKDWENVKTELLSDKAIVKYESEIKKSGIYGIGVYKSATETIVINETDEDVEDDEKDECVSVWECESFSRCVNGLRTRECIDVNKCSVLSPKKIETEECEVVPTCDDGIQNGDEEGIDCGGSCPNPCEDKLDPGLEKPRDVINESEKNLSAIVWSIAVVILLLAVVVTGIEVVVHKKHSKMLKKKSKFVEQKKGARTHLNLKLINLIIIKIIDNLSYEEIKSNLLNNKYSEIEIKSNYSLVNYIISHLRMNNTEENIANALVSSGWNEKDADMIIDHVIIQMIIYQIKKFNLESSIIEDREMLMEIFKEDGFADDVIEKAFELMSRSKNRLIKVLDKKK